MQKRSLIALMIAALSLAACTKSKELQNKVSPDAYFAKSELQGRTFHLSRGVEDADSNNTVGATPGMSEDYGLVRARITADELQFISVFEPNGRADTNTIVASYKITSQFDIKRDTNDYGNSTNKIVEDVSQPWQDRAYVRVDWTKPTNSLSNYANSLASGSDDENGGLTEENTVLLEDPKFEAGHISFLVETSVKAAGKSETHTFPMSTKTNPAYRVVYRTHLMELKPSDFKPIPYTYRDFERFGYFFTQQDFQDPHGLLEKNQNLFANAHNVCEAGGAGSCATNRIRWVLSKDFPEFYKATARKVVKEWNETFKQALNRQDDVVWLDESVEASLSDPTVNVLALYPNRTKSGLLGVAQWVSDPRTGEMNGVRATVFGDGIEAVVASVDDKINLLVSDDPLKDVIGTSGFGAPVVYVSPFNDQAQTKLIASNARTLKRPLLRKGSAGVIKTPIQMPTATSIVRDVRAVMDSSPLSGSVRAMKLAGKVPELLVPRDADLVAEDAKTSPISFPSTYAGFQIPTLGGMEALLFTEAKLAADRSNLIHDAEHGTHGTDLVEDAAIRYLYSYLAKGASKADLESNRKRIEDDIRQLTFYTTALHEMGHAFGLRHNFAGSADKAHYPAEYRALLAKMDPANSAYDPSVTADDLAPYESSSIMDYTRDFFDQKNGLGLYDKAAIKYVYNRSIDKNSDPVTRERFAFCTDHQVGESALCQRFDKGHNLSEMVAADVDLYDHNYAMWHYRRGRLSEGNAMMWGSPRALQMMLLSRIFLPVRQVMDEFLYSFIASDDADGTGFCSRLFVKASVDAHEMMPICSAQDMANAGVDPNDLSTLVNALYRHDANGELVVDADGQPVRLMASANYKPYGLADLIWSNSVATGFFQRVLGSPEPGTYLAVPTQKNGFQLVAVSEDDDLKQVALAQQQKNEIAPEIAQVFTQTPEQFTTEIKVGGYGRQFDSRTSTVGGWIRNESLGSFYDKLAALRALSIPGLAAKYTKDSMVGNTYVFPQTRQWTSQLFSRLITADPYVASIPVQLKSGSTVTADVPASTSLDLQTMTSVVALTYMASDSDRSMIDNLTICDANQAECGAAQTTGETAAYKSVFTGNTFRTFQTIDKNSIAYKLITATRANADDRANFVAVKANAGRIQTAALMTIAKPEVKALFDKISSETLSDPKLNAFRFTPTMGWKDVLPLQWSNLVYVTQNMNQISDDKGYAFSKTFQNAYVMLVKQADDTLKAMGPVGQCWVMKMHPEVVAETDRPHLTKEQIDARLEALASGQPIPASAMTVKVPACSADDMSAGPVRYNLLLLGADLKTLKTALLDPVVQPEIDVFRAPSQIDGDTRLLRAQENQIELLRKLVYQATH